MTPKQYREVQTHQSKVLDDIANAPFVDAHPIVDGILRRIVNYSDGAIRAGLGSFGLKLKDFAQSVDLDQPHPDLYYIKNTLNDKDLNDLLEIGKYATDIGVSSFIIERLSKIVSKLEGFKLLSRSIGNPSRSLCHVRFIADPDLRDRIRHNKLSQQIKLNILRERGQSYWDQQPASFHQFARFENRFASDIEQAKLRLQHFKDHNLLSMAQEISDSVQILEQKSKDDQYYGFNKISIVAANIILAKVHECAFELEYQAYYSTPSHYGIFGWVNECEGENIKPEDIIQRKREYHGVLHPFCAIRSFANEKMKNLVSHLDAFPECGGKPLFDHYWVLIPTYTEIGKVPNKIPIHTYLRTIGVLLGERDGQIYFVSYWM